MKRDRQFHYKGRAVTVRWTKKPSGASVAFTVSYSIDSAAWCHVTEHVFLTFETAAAFGVAEAQRAIDALTKR